MSIHSCTEPTGYIEPKVTKEGQASIAPKTVGQTFAETVSKHGSRPALHLKRPVNVSCGHMNNMGVCESPLQCWCCSWLCLGCFFILHDVSSNDHILTAASLLGLYSRWMANMDVEAVLGRLLRLREESDSSEGRSLQSHQHHWIQFTWVVDCE